MSILHGYRPHETVGYMRQVRRLLPGSLVHVILSDEGHCHLLTANEKSERECGRCGNLRPRSAGFEYNRPSGQIGV